MPSPLSSLMKDTDRGIYLIGTCPPKEGTSIEQATEIAGKLAARMQGLDVDGMIVYDIQDESSRTDKPRPFPFKHTLDACVYSGIIGDAAGKPTITYKSVSQRDRASFQQWLDAAANDFGINDIVLVGSPSSEGDIKLSLKDAYEEVAKSTHDFSLGGVTIAERHIKKRTEHERLMSKAEQGCNFFISQAVYDAQATIDMLASYARSCKAEGKAPARVVLTFTPCGSAKTLEFMEWLGISVPEATKFRMLDAENTLAESVLICRQNLEQILDAVLPLGIPLGLNIESLTNRKEEIDASIRLFKLLKATLDLRLAEQQL